MKATYSLIILSVFLASCHKSNLVKESDNSPSLNSNLTPTTVLSASEPEEWRLIDVNNTLYLTLDAGIVVIELLPDLAPSHVENTKVLIRQGVFNGTNFYRVIDGFVAQGGPMFESESEMKQLTEGAYSVPSELTFKGNLANDYTMFDQDDGYADETGFYKSFAIGKDLKTGENWMLHCYGALGMGRANELDSGGTELYIVNGHSQRYLDRNVTIFGRVIAGMQHIQALKRSSDINGAIDLTGQNIIKKIAVAADMPTDQIKPIEVLDSNSASFKKLLAARKNRTGEWFVYQHDYMDACGVPIPVRLRTTDP